MSDERPVVLFDLDGVLTRGDTFAGFLARRLLRHRPPLVALALPLVPLLLLGPTRRGAGELLVRLAMSRLSVAGYRAAAAAQAGRLARRPGAVRAACVAEVRRHLDAGARVVVVTACEETLARALLDRVGLRDAELVASRLRRTGRGWRVALHDHGAEKPRQLAARGIHPPWALAYSDSAYDLPLLGGAQEAVLVNPGRTLRARAAAELSGRVRAVRWRA